MLIILIKFKPRKVQISNVIFSVIYNIGTVFIILHFLQNLSMGPNKLEWYIRLS